MNVQVPSIYDPSLSPVGHHVLSAWTLYAPTKLKEGSWEIEGPRVGKQLIDILSEYIPNFRESIVDWSLQTPQDIEARQFLTDGNIRHIDITSSQIMAGRMPYRSSIERMYLCGSGAHPGGEITGVPGHNAAKAILKDLKKVAV